MAKAPEKGVEIKIERLLTRQMQVHLLGVSPILFNTMSAKAKRELLLPRGRLTAADKAERLKHDPITEFRDSMSLYGVNEDAPTRVRMPSPAFKGALATAALDVPGQATKSKINRLVWVESQEVPIYGIPLVRMDTVRMADMARTPDMRTRACMREWAATIVVSFISPILNEQSIATLIDAGGLICGVGDFRQEKGKGSYGRYQIVNDDDETFQRLVRECGRDAQTEAIENPQFWDAETEELIGWYHEEILRRKSAPKPEPKRRKNTAEASLQ